MEESAAGDGGLLSVPSGSSSFSNDGIVRIVGGASLVRSGGDASLSAGSYAGGIEGAVRLASGSGSPIIGSGSLIGGRGGSDIGEGARISSDYCSFADSGSVALSNADNAGTCFYCLQHNDSL